MGVEISLKDSVRVTDEHQKHQKMVLVEREFCTNRDTEWGLDDVDVRFLWQKCSSSENKQAVLAVVQTIRAQI